MRAIDADHLKQYILSRVFKTQLSVADVIDQIDREDTIESEQIGGDYCMSRISFNEVHQKSLDTINKMISDMDAAGCQSEKINSNIITACLIEMNGYLAAIAESLINEEES